MRRFVSLVVLSLLLEARGAAAGEAPAKTRALNVAFVLLPEVKLPKGEEIEKAFADFAAKGQKVRLKARKAAKGSNESLELALNAGGTAIVMLMPQPVPNREADDAVRYSVSAFEGRWKLPPHKAHLVVTTTEEATRLEALQSFTSLVAAVTKVSSAVGVYLGGAGATHDPKFLLGVAREPDAKMRLVLWSGVSIANAPGNRLNVLSLGMRQFGLPDILLNIPPDKSKDALGTLFDLIGFAVDLGKPLPEGETFGRTDAEKIPVHYVPSPVDPRVKVWRVAFD
jgi:hypothetical protein